MPSPCFVRPRLLFSFSTLHCGVFYSSFLFIFFPSILSRCRSRWVNLPPSSSVEPVPPPVPSKKNRRHTRLLSKSASSADVTSSRPQSASPIQPSPSLSQVIEETVEEMTTRPISPAPRSMTVISPPPAPQPPPPPARVVSPTPPRRVTSPKLNEKKCNDIDPFKLDRPDSRLSVKRETILRGVIIKGIVCTPAQASCKQRVREVAANKMSSTAKKQAPQPPPNGEPKTKKQTGRSSMLIGRPKSAVPPATSFKARPKSMPSNGSDVKSKK